MTQRKSSCGRPLIPEPSAGQGRTLPDGEMYFPAGSFSWRQEGPGQRGETASLKPPSQGVAGGMNCVRDTHLGWSPWQGQETVLSRTEQGAVLVGMLS